MSSAADEVAGVDAAVDAGVESAVTVCFVIVPAPAAVLAVLAAVAEMAVGLEVLAPPAEAEEKKMLCEVPEATGMETLLPAAVEAAAAVAPETVKELTGSPASAQSSSSSRWGLMGCGAEG